MPSIALCFFGKHGIYGDRSSELLPTTLASVNLLNASHRAWHKHLILANSGSQFSVFAHSWSPEVSAVFAERWAAHLVTAMHEPTRYNLSASDEPQTVKAGRPLMFKCTVAQR